MDELKNDITKITPASFEPTIDYIVTKIPRFTFEKFSETEEKLGTTMKSIGECMAIGRNFKESFQKLPRSLEIGLDGLNSNKNLKAKKKEKLEILLEKNLPNKFLIIAEALRKGIDINTIIKKSKYDYWFIREIDEIIKLEKILKKNLNLIFIKNVRLLAFQILES